MEGCPGVLATRAAMRVHMCTGMSTTPWLYWRRATPPLPRCPRCDLQVSRKALNGRHLGTSQCRTGTESKRRRLSEAEMRITSERAFHAYGKQMREVTEFRYLGRVLTATDDDWPAVAGNIRKARVSWGCLARVLGREGADPKVSRSFYTAVTQQVLLFGAQSWVLTIHVESSDDSTWEGRNTTAPLGPPDIRGAQDV